MGFVNEEINTPERIREFDAFKLISPVNGQPPERWRWTVDRERGFYLVSLGAGFSGSPDTFALVTPEGTIRIAGYEDTKGKIADRSVEISWRIEDVKIPRRLSPRASALMSVIKEALVACGSTFDSKPVRNVEVSLPSPTFV